MADPITNSVVGIAGKVLGKFVADKNLKMQLEHELKTQLQTANLAQIEVNKIEAASKNRFVAGWRPSVGWVCSLAMMYHFILAPMIQFAVGIAGNITLSEIVGFSIVLQVIDDNGLQTFNEFVRKHISPDTEAIYTDDFSNN